MKKKIAALGKFLLKTPWLVANNIFIAGLFVFFIAFIVSGFLFYKRIIATEEGESATPKSVLQIDGGNYGRFLNFRQEQGLIFNGTGCEFCRYIFNLPSPR